MSFHILYAFMTFLTFVACPANATYCIERDVSWTMPSVKLCAVVELNPELKEFTKLLLDSGCQVCQQRMQCQNLGTLTYLQSVWTSKAVPILTLMIDVCTTAWF